MTYKSILTYLDSSPRLDERIKVSLELTERFDAHLNGIAPTGLATSMPGDYLSVTTDFVEEMQSHLNEIAKTAADTFEATCRQSTVNTYESHVVVGNSMDTLLQHSRHNDLVIIGQAEPTGPSKGATPGFVEQIILVSGRPVLVVPYIGVKKPIGKHVIVGWDAGRESARALTDALPILQAAEQVELVSVAPANAKRDEDEVVGAEIALFLARHGVKVQFKQITSNMDVGNTLLSHAVDFDADLLVMGAYGHSRIREWVMGGTTKTILQSMTIPVLFAH